MLSKFYHSFLLVVTVVCLLSGLQAQQSQPFEAEIRAFERADSLNRPAPGQILLYGSSTLRLWSTYQQDLAGFQVINRGFGGSQMSDAIYYFDRVVVPLAPSWILLYEGDNDLSSRKTPEQVLADFETFMQLAKAKLPNTRVAIYAVKPSNSRKHLMPEQQKLNKLLRQYCRKYPKSAKFIDIYPPLLENGMPNPALFLEDELHLNAEGYQVWTKATREFLTKHQAK